MASTSGVLILHGFTGSRATVAPVVPIAESLGLAWSLPRLRGHWTHPDDLHGVIYEDMLSDALAAFDELRSRADQIAIVGLSVGGLIALDLATRRAADLKALAVLAPAMSYANPLSRFSGVISRFAKTFSGEPGSGFSDATYAAAHTDNYTYFPTKTFHSVRRAAFPVARRLGDIMTPTLVIGARNDRVVRPDASQLVYDRLGTREKQLVWFEHSGHELLIDCEGEAVGKRIGEFLVKELGIASGKPDQNPVPQIAQLA